MTATSSPRARLRAAPYAPDAPPRVLVVSGSVGAGHDGAANELAARLRAAGVQVDVRDFLDALPGPVPGLLRDGYALTVDKVPGVFTWLFRRLEDRGPVQALMLATCRLGAPTVHGWLAEGRYDVAVSTYPLASQCLGGLRDRGLAPVPLVTYLTDPAVHRSWVHPSVDLHLTVTAAAARQGTTSYGLSMVEAGPLVPARFSRRTPVAALRRELGLSPGRPVALLVAGSLGLGDVVTSAEHVAAAGLVPLVLCGRNAGLLARVRDVPGVVALGWRDDVHVLMQLADVLVHNAGGLSLTEALVAGLPAVTYRCIPGHGQANAAVLHDAGLAPWARDEQELAAALRDRLAAARTPPSVLDPADAVLALLPDAPALRNSA